MGQYHRRKHGLPKHTEFGTWVLFVVVAVLVVYGVCQFCWLVLKQ